MFEKRKIEDNKAFKQLAINDITRIASEANKNNDFELADHLRDLINQIDSTPITASKELPFFYVAIRGYCIDITNDLNGKDFQTAKVRIKEFERVVKELVAFAEQNKLSISSKQNKINARVEGRLEKFIKKSGIQINKKDYSASKIPVDALYPVETLAEIRIARLQDRLDRVNNELNALRSSRDFNQLIKSQIQAKKQEIDTIKQILQIANNALFRENQLELIKSASEEVKKEYAQLTKKNYASYEQDILDDWEKIKAAHNITSADEASMKAEADSDLEEKFYELMHDVEYINEEIGETTKAISRILRKVKDLSEDLENASGTEKQTIEGQIRDLKIQYQQLAQKQKLLNQRKVDSQAAYQVLARNKDFQEIQERYAGLSSTNLEALKGLAMQLNENIEKANAAHDELNDISGLVVGNEIKTDTALDTDFANADGVASDLEDIIKLAEQEG